MDPRRFDSWARNRALRLSRRDALRLAGAGTGAALLSPASALAQGSSICSVTIHAETAAGPSAPATYDGILAFTLDPDGALANATFSSATGNSSVTSIATGRSIDLQITLATDRVLVLSGVADDPVSDCLGALGGLLSGPLPGDLGAWEATSKSSSAATSSGGTKPSGAQSSSSSSSGIGCPPPQTTCGPNCCPAGATCTDAATGICACPDGSIQCGLRCVQDCTDGQSLDLDTCTCPQQEAACIQNQQTCQNHGQCCSGYCGGGTCFDCAGKVCGEFGCIDPSRDSQNCGNCGVVCVSPQVCSNGVCGCGSDGAPCVFDNECCSQTCFSNGICGRCDPPWTYCGTGTCLDLSRSLENCGACGNVCSGEPGGITCDSGVCHDFRNDADYCGFQHLVCPSGQICRAGYCVTP